MEREKLTARILAVTPVNVGRTREKKERGMEARILATIEEGGKGKRGGEEGRREEEEKPGRSPTAKRPVAKGPRERGGRQSGKGKRARKQGEREKRCGWNTNGITVEKSKRRD